MATGGGRRAVLAALVGNGTLTVAKFVSWTLSGSSTMLAEAVHSAADTGNQALLLLGVRQSRMATDEDHRFGYRRQRYFWSFAVAIVAFIVGSVLAIHNGIDKIVTPEPIDNVAVALSVLGAGIIVQGLILRTALAAALPQRRKLSWWQFIRRSRQPELPVLLLEDFAAQVGLIVAFVAIAASRFTGDPVWDGIGSLAIGILLGVIAVVLIIEMQSLLIGVGAGPRDTDKVRSAILTRPEVLELVHLRTLYLGPEELLVAARIEFDASLSMSELADAVQAVERTVRAEIPHARPMYIEPKLDRFASAPTSGEKSDGHDPNL